MSASLRKLPTLKRVTGMAFMACMASLVGEHWYHLHGFSIQTRIFDRSYVSRTQKVFEYH